MTPSNQPDAHPTRDILAAQLSAELIRLRNALVSLSINLKDWQFEIDQNCKLASKKIAIEVINKCRLQRPTDAGTSEASGSTDAKD